ncbi:hypothetical protein ACIP1T_19815 [Pseudomonas japonica]|uniref:hypothetical protein n=1 Tax=Pseudomonas japonica TaxID=256466 RepID=UPI003827BBCD
MMRRNGYFSGLLKPVPQEAFSAWLERGLYGKQPLLFLQAKECLKHHGVEDADAPLSPPVVEAVCKALGLPKEYFKQTFSLPGDWLKASPKKRFRYCEICLLLDFLFHRQPTARVTWFYWWFNVCPLHGCLLLEEESTSAPEALHSMIRKNQALMPFDGWVIKSYIKRRQNLSRDSFKVLLLMALEFQQWYQHSVQRGTFLVDGAAVGLAEMERFLSDLLAIIGKKRVYPGDPLPDIAQTLRIKSWCTLSSSLPIDSGCEPFLCLDPGEHSGDIRMAMFAFLGLLLKLPHCVHLWPAGKGPINERWFAKIWIGMHSDARRVPSYFSWLRQRSEEWSEPVRIHFQYLIADGTREIRPGEKVKSWTEKEANPLVRSTR